MRVAMQKAFEATNDRNDIIGVEVGVDQAIHAFEILTQWKKIKTLHLVDNYCIRNVSNYGDARVKLEIFKDRVKWHLLKSLETAMLFDDNSLDFVYIDASHAYLDVLSDCIIWYQKVKVGSILCGHDYRLDWECMDKYSATFKNSHGVVRAVKEFVKMKNEDNIKIVLGIKTDGSSSDWWIKKC